MQAWIIDTFADGRYRGNPAGVIRPAGRFPATAEMQAVACHLALPTTAFVVDAGTGRYRIRWFTPEKELNICGHATIAAAAYLYDVENVARSTPLCFQTHAGALHAQREDRYIFLNLPAMEVSVGDPPADLADALGTGIVYCARAVDDILIELESEDAVANLRPDFARLRRIECRGHVVTAKSSREHVDFVSRSFFPALGVNEDQVCVSAHCKLGPYWARKLGKRRLLAVQLSTRGGQLALEVMGEEIRVAGTAIVRESIVLDDHLCVSTQSP